MVTLKFKVISLTLAKGLNSWVTQEITYLITMTNNDLMKLNSDNTCEKS